MLLDTLNTVARPSIRKGSPYPELCAAVAESDFVSMWIEPALGSVPHFLNFVQL